MDHLKINIQMIILQHYIADYQIEIDGK